MNPSEAILAVTYRCNSRCTHCDIWQKKLDGQEAAPSFYYRLPRSLRLVNLTGGEPFLRDDLVEAAMVVTERCGRPALHLSTNGIATDRILAAVKEIRRINPRTGVRISIDGAQQTHDRIRGVPGAFEKAMATLEGLKASGLRDLGIAFTLSRGNEHELMKIHRLARSLRVDFSTAVVHSSAFFFGEKQEMVPEVLAARSALGELERAQLRGLRPKQWLRAFFTHGQIAHLAGDPVPVACGALREFIFVDPFGTVYPCNVLDVPVGNLSDGTLEELIVRNPAAMEAVKQCRKNCWMVCTARPMMRRAPWRPLGWIAARKLIPGVRR